MFVVILKYSENKARANELMFGHKQWLQKGFDDGVFALAGSLQPGLGGGIIAYGLSRTELQNRVNEDPFVTEQVVSAEILEISPSKSDKRLGFL